MNKKEIERLEKLTTKDAFFTYCGILTIIIIVIIPLPLLAIPFAFETSIIFFIGFCMTLIPFLVIVLIQFKLAAIRLATMYIQYERTVKEIQSNISGENQTIGSGLESKDFKQSLSRAINRKISALEEIEYALQNPYQPYKQLIIKILNIE